MKIDISLDDEKCFLQNPARKESYDEIESDGSVDTHEALMDMLGLPNSVKEGDIFDEEVDDVISNCCGSTKSSSTSSSPLSYTSIDLPSRCSRNLLSPSSCLACVVDNVLTEAQCKYLIQAAYDSSHGFRYITEATHKAPDGSSYTVQIQKPNPHKLTIVDTMHDPLSSASDTRYRSNEHENMEGTIIMDQIYAAISSVLNGSNPSYQKFVSRTNCGSHKGLNPRMRILKYDAEHNDRFEPHFDATTFVPKNGNTYMDTNKRHQSLITVLVYLNNGDGEHFEGGETIFLDYHNSLSTGNRLGSETDVKITPRIGRVVLFEHNLFHSGSPLVSGTKLVMRTDVLFDEHETSTVLDDKQQIDSIAGVEDDTIGIGDENPPEFELLIDVCKKLNLSQTDTQILDDMGLLYVSLDAFISPGITLLKEMLVDGGLQHDLVQTLIQRVISLRNK